MLTFQKIITRLTQFWTEHGCALHQGHDVEVGAGTFNPTTFLRSLGPEPYNSVYVEPSRRPQDGRYGQNPNRTQLFHQLQVIMKPSPANIQELYLKSLEAIGFDLSEHDIRFVHDDWESPTLGAWGLGWEVWIDGMEATQFTYFQSVAGFNLSPISVELTYGLERLCMFVQKKASFFEMEYSEGLSYGEVFKRSELEWSRYNFDYASTSMWLRHFEDYEREAKYLIESNLPLPAYDFAMKASHAFNILEARGVLSTTERTNYIHRIRELSRLSAIEYLTSREAQGFPLLSDVTEVKSIRLPEDMPATFDKSTKSDFLFEIGSEQLPATFIPIGMRGLKTAVENLFKTEGLSYGKIELFGTPQRLAILVKDLAGGASDESVERRGPLIDIAFNEGGLTKQGAGFARSIGREKPFSLEDVRDGGVEGLEIREIKGSEYLFVNSVKKGKSAFEILSTNLPNITLNLPFPKSMQWGGFDISYARPIKWLVSLHDSEIIPFQIADVQTGNTTFGHAQLTPGPIQLDAPSEYVDKLRQAKVVANLNERRELIEKQLNKLESKYGVKAAARNTVLNEVTNLTEWPELAVHTFDESYLRAPKEVLISEMVQHQRYFPLVSDETLTNMFVITADNKVNPTILENNGKVLSARLSDGVFLYEQDVEMGLAKMNELLATVTYHKELGSVQEKVDRIVKNAQLLAETLESDAKAPVRAAELCKADLCSNLVREFPELQGTLGKYYALAGNETPDVANAIEEHYLPNSEGGALPQTIAGKIVSLADKIDNLLSCMSIGIKATSSSDPYALRRQAFGVIKIVIDNQWSIDLERLFIKISDNPNLARDVLTFFRNRMKSVLLDYNFNKDEIEAALPKSVSDPYDAYCKVQALHSFRTSAAFAPLYEVYKRARGQIEDEGKQSVNQGLLGEPSEHMLYSSLTNMRVNFDKALEMGDYTSAFTTLSTLQKPLADLFDQVKILSDNTSIRNNRIALLQQVFAYFNRLLDFSKIQ